MVTSACSAVPRFLYFASGCFALLTILLPLQSSLSVGVYEGNPGVW